MVKLNLSGIIIILLLLCFNNSFASTDTLKYVFIGHPYDWSINSKVDLVVENMDTSEFDGIWLGGDFCSEASLYKSTIDIV